MSRKRKKRRQLNQSRPVTYLAVDADEVKRNVAPELLKTARAGNCHRCGKDVLMRTDHFNLTVALCERVKRQLVVLCNRCGEQNVTQHLSDGHPLGVIGPGSISEEEERIQQRFRLSLN